MFFKLKGSNLYQALLDRLYMNFTGTRKQAITTDQRNAGKTTAAAKQMPLQDAVWHRSKSARYQQN